jgi:hypothetical protein
VVKRKAVVKSKTKGVRLFPPIPRGFDAEKATNRDLLRLGLPLRPDPSRQPGLTALWDRDVRRFRGFEHLQAAITPADLVVDRPVSFLGLFPREACGYELSSSAPFTVFSGRWTVPNLHHGPTPPGLVFFRTFFGLGFLDVHVEMTVDSNQDVTAQITIHTGAQLNLPVAPGDTINATLCLQTNAAGTASYFLANQTTKQTVNLTMDTGFPPAVTIDAGISRGVTDNPNNPLAGFGTVYFDELSAFTTSGARQLTDGVATTMVDGGTTLARPLRLTDYAFRIEHA